MRIERVSAVVTGGASGLGFATATRLTRAGAIVVIADLPDSPGPARATALGERARFVPADVTDESQLGAVMDAADELAPLRVLVHCAGRGNAGRTVRIVHKDGSPGSLDVFRQVLDVNLAGTFNALRLAAAKMAAHEPVDGERGVCVLTASVAAFEGQVGQMPYAASKAGVAGMTIVAARDLASRLIRVATIAPGTFDTPMLARLSDSVRESLAEAVPHPRRLGRPEEYAQLAQAIIENPMLNGETIRLDGAIRMPPR